MKMSVRYCEHNDLRHSLCAGFTLLVRPIYAATNALSINLFDRKAFPAIRLRP